MRRYFKSTGYSLFFCFSLILMASCNDDKGKKEDDNSAAVAKAPTPASLTPGKLDTLSIDRDVFDSIKGNPKITYSFVFIASDTLTLAGWVFKGNKYDSLPNMTLKNESHSGLTYEIGTYFGNVEISSNDFAKIILALKDASMKYVLFAPEKRGNNIKYKVFVSDKQSGFKNAILVISPTGADANPSPPKNS